MLLMRIATTLGKSLRWVERLDADEVLWWEALFEVDPPGEQRMDLRFAMLLQMVAAMGGSKLSLQSLMPYPLAGAVEQEPMAPKELAGLMNQAQSWLNHGNNNR